MIAFLYQRSWIAMLERVGGERVAPADVPGVEAAPEPAHALRGGAVGERLRRHVALGLALEPVVTDGRRRGESLLEIAGLEDVARPIGMVSPDAGEAVRLELLPNRERVRLGPADAVARGHDALGDAQQRLHVMPDLVGDDVRLREVARGAEAI